ncbi:MAG TPA: BlaI/MecI/CopY family transcriptional regulator [Gammaproteobacteria bacterium]|nr:BlaI/MecI/CopY family transcriptional regulator [Gammaproteobacteria bacterium]
MGLKNKTADTRLPRPTAAELGILRALWKLGPSTVRQVQEHLLQEDAVGYTTVLKFLQIMHAKGLVDRDESERAHVYAPRVTKDETQRQLMSHLIDKAFDGSRSQLVLQALGDSKRASAEELEQIRALLARLEEGRS